MRLTLTLFMLQLCAQLAFADSIYVGPVEGTNVEESQAKALRELIKVEVQNEGSHRLVEKMDEAGYYLKTKLIKFKTYTLSMTRWQGNREVATGQWKVNSPKELEAKITEAVKEVLNTKAAPGAIPVSNGEKSLSQQAAEKKQRANFERVEARRQVLLGFGPAYFSNMNSPGTGIGFSAGYVWNVDDHFDLGLISDFAIATEHSDAYMFSGKIFTNYIFMAKDISPFLGAAFGYGWANAHEPPNLVDDTASGFAVTLQGGVKFFRTSNVNLAVSGEFTQIFDELKPLGDPGSFLVKLALLF